MSLNQIIELYRFVDKPPCEGGTFSARLNFNPDIASLIQSIRNTNQTARFEEILVNDNEILDDEDVPSEESSLSFSLRLPTSSANRFYNSIEDLINRSSVSKGKLPSEFYIIDIDYENGSNTEPVQIENLREICKAIHFLSELANYHDEKTSEGYYKLVFLHADETSASPATVIDTKVKQEMLALPKLNTSRLHGLCSEDASINPHYNTQIGVFAVTIATFLSSKPAGQAFFYLVKNWHDFLTLYQNNHATFLSGFAFHKAKKEVAEAELNIAEQFSKVISDITGKLLSIPISIAAVIVIAKSSSLLENTLLVLGLLLAAVLVAGTIDNQQRQLVRITDAKDVVFNALEGRKDSYPQDLKDILDKIIKDLKNNQGNLKSLLRVFRCLSWVPVSIGIIVHIATNSNWLSTILLF